MSKAKILKIGGICLAGVVAVSVAVCALVPTIRNSITTSLMKPESLYQKAEGKLFTKTTENVTNVFAKVEEVVNGDIEAGFNASYKIIFGDAMKSQMPEGFNDFAVSSSFNTKDTKTSTSSSLKGNDKDLLTVNTLIDTEKPEGYVQIPQLNPAYIKASQEEIQEFMDEINASMNYSTDSFATLEDEFNTMLEELDITEDDIVNLIDRYSNLYIEGTSEVEKDTTEIDIDGKDYKVTELTFEVTYQTLLDIGEDVLKEMKKDDVLIKLVTSTGELTQEDWEATIDEAIESLKSADAESAGVDLDEKLFDITTYIDNATQTTIGKAFEMGSAGQSIEAGFIQIDNDKEYAVKSWAEVMGEDIYSMEGSAEKDGELLTGDFEVVYGVDGDEISVKMSYDKFGVADEENGLISGECDIKFEVEGQSFEMSLDASAKNKEQTISTNFKVDGEDYMTVEISYEETEVSDIKFPGDSDKIYDVSDETGMTEYFENMDLEGFESNATDVLGEDIVNSLSSLLSTDDYDYDDTDTDTDTNTDTEEELVYNGGLADLEVTVKGEKIALPCTVETLGISVLTKEDAILTPNDIGFGNGVNEDGEEDYSVGIRFRNNTEEDAKTEECVIERFSVTQYSHNKADIKINGIGIGSKVEDIEKAFGFKISEDEYYVSFDLSDEDNSISFQIYDGLVSGVSFDLWEY